MDFFMFIKHCNPYGFFRKKFREIKTQKNDKYRDKNRINKFCQKRIFV